MRVGVIGGGIAGLVAAYEMSRAGAQVTLFERASRLGGLAGSFLIAKDQEIERYYHFICKGDQAYLDLLEKMGLKKKLRWVTTEMGLFYNGALYRLGDLPSLLAFPHLSLRDKARFGWATLAAKRRGSADWKSIENISVRDWLVENYGQNAYEMLYEPLLSAKFGAHLPRISAAWMWARFHRLGNSRTRLTQKERIGYLEGGSQVYIDALERALRAQEVVVHTNAVVERVVVANNRARGVQIDGELVPFDCVVSTVPIPHTRDLFAGIEGPYFENLRQLEYTGVMVLLLQLDRRFSPYYWMNVNDARLPLSGVIEYTNLNPYPALNGNAILYLPHYLPHTDPLYQTPDDVLFERHCQALKIINPRFERSWVRRYWIHRDKWAQPICQVGFSRHVPAVQTPIPNLLLTDSYQLHPHDRAISFSTELGQQAARLALGS